MSPSPRTHQKSAFLLACALMIGGCGTSYTPEQHIERAAALRADGNIVGAMLELRSAAQEAPDHAQVRWELGELYLRILDGASAAKELERSIELGYEPVSAPVALTRAALLQGRFQDVVDAAIAEVVQEGGNGSSATETLPAELRAEFQALRGHAYLAVGNLDLAREAYAQSEQLQPGNAEAALGAARLAVVERDVDRARAVLEQLVAAHPEFAPGWSLLGEIELRGGDAAKAEEHYTRAIANTPVAGEDQYRRALLRIDRQDFSGAREDLNALRGSRPNHPGVEFGLGLIDLYRKDYQTALIRFSDAEKKLPNDPVLSYYVGAANYHLGNHEQAEVAFRRYFARFPNSIPVATYLASVYLGRQDAEAAREVIETALAWNPDSDRLRELLAIAMLHADAPDAALTQMAQLAERQPESADIQLKAGVVNLAAGRTDDAVASMEAALAMEPDSERAMLILGATYLQAGQFDKAQAMAVQIGERLPDKAAGPRLMGQTLLAAGDPAGAAAAFEAALAREPGDPLATRLRAGLYIREQKLDEAQRLLQSAAERNPQDLSVLLPLVALEAQLGNVTGAVARLQAAIAASPDALVPRLVLAGYHRGMGATDKALAMLEEIRDANENNAAWLTEVGRLQLARGEHEAAVANLKKLVGMMPRSAVGHTLLARAYAGVNDAPGVRRELLEALRQDADYLPAQLAMVNVLITEQRYADAADLIAKARARHGDLPDLTASQAVIDLAQGRLEDSIAGFKAALDKAPNSRWVIQLAFAQGQSGRSEDGVATLRQWVEKYPQDDMAWAALAQTYDVMGRAPEAIAAYEKVLEIAPNSSAALNNLAWLLRDSDRARALQLAERANAINPDTPQFIDTQAMILLAGGDSARAVELLQRAHGLAPSALNVRYHLAVALERNGQSNLALAHLQEVLAADRPFADRRQAEEMLARLRPN